MSLRHLWAIGVDNDQWFDVPPEQQPHLLTSIIKRGDVAAFLLVEHMLDEGPPGVVARLGMADEGFDYSTQGGRLTGAMIARLDNAVADIGDERIEVPISPTGPTLTLDAAGGTIDVQVSEADRPTGFDGLAQYSPIEAGTYELLALGTPLTVTIEGDWWLQPNIAGETALSHPESGRLGDRDVVFIRANFMADPTNPGAPIEEQEAWPLEDIDGWLANLVDGIVTEGPVPVEIGGRSAVYFEAEIADPSVCGPLFFCAGFVVNRALQNGQTISGWSFEPGFHQRVWWVDGGDQLPLVIIASNASSDRSFQAQADVLLDSLVIGDPRPHPAPAE